MMVTVRKKFFHVRQNMNRFRSYWERKIYDKYWRINKREKRKR